jgi:sugar lactone lactonase YvrE
MTDVGCVLDARSLLGEGPLWDPETRVLYWVDIKQREIHRFDPASGQDERWSTPEDIGSLAVRAKGGLVVAMKSGFHIFDPVTAKFTPVFDPEHHLPGNRFNDGKPDRRGRFWAGSMDDAEKSPTGGLYRLGIDYTCKRMVDGIICSNALCWSPDDRTLYYADSCRHTIWAWDFDADAGEISNRRVFVEVSPSEGDPDGATVDADGGVWVAHWGGWRITRYDPKGRVDRVVKMPVQKPTCPMFGGPSLDVIYVTSASIQLTPDELKQQPQAGSIFAFEPGVKGLPEAPFSG